MLNTQEGKDTKTSYIFDNLQCCQLK